MTKKVVLSGYYGFDNIGDEAVLYSIIEALRLKMNNKVDITVFSANPEKTQRLYGIKAVDRWNKKALYRAIKESDLLISGGGSLLQDITSANSPIYYLGIIKLAQLLKKPVVIYAQGIGPLLRKRNRWLCGKILNKATAITVRDKESAEELANLGVKAIVNVTADPVLAMTRDMVDQNLGKELLREIGFDFAKKTVMVSLRPWQNDEHAIKVARLCDQLKKEDWQVVLLPMQAEQDMPILVKVKEAMEESVLLLERQCTPREMFSIFSFADRVLGMRLHALIMATALNIGAVGIVYDPKVASFMESVKNKNYLSWDKLDENLLNNMLKQEFNDISELKQLQEKAIVPACFISSILL